MSKRPQAADHSLSPTMPDKYPPLKSSFLTVLFLLISASLRAYVTSATLEYTVNDELSIYLNGSPVVDRSDFHPYDFEVLSTSDGTLPADLFVVPGRNLLAVEDHEVDSALLQCSFRLTIHRSDGDPIVVWSDPDHFKMLHVPRQVADPEAWMLPDFDDVSWTAAVRGTELVSPSWVIPSLPDPAFSGGFGLDANVPHLTHSFNFRTSPRDRNLFRGDFFIPDRPENVRIRVDPNHAALGQRIRVELSPGPDSANMERFTLRTWVPKGLQLLDVMPGYEWTPEQRRLSWRFYRWDLKISYAHMPASAVLAADGWRQPNLVLGPAKKGKTTRELNVPHALYFKGARFTANRPAWFKLAPPRVDLAHGRPVILGVIFRSQVMLGGTDTANRTDADTLKFNYSVDGTEHGALTRDAKIGHNMSSGGYWFDAYYDASEDRVWTWEDLDKLAVMVKAKANGTMSTDMMASIVATVKYYDPAKVSPWFDAKVTESNCSFLPLKAALEQGGLATVYSEPAGLSVNQGLCSPTPTATPPPERNRILPPANPVAAPGPNPAGISMASENYFHLGCLSADPEPFNDAGTFVSYCLGRDAALLLNVYHSDTGKLVRTANEGAVSAGQGQIYFNALDDHGRPLAAGAYIFELEASGNGKKEKRSAIFHVMKRTFPEPAP